MGTASALTSDGAFRQSRCQWDDWRPKHRRGKFRWQPQAQNRPSDQRCHCRSGEGRNRFRKNHRKLEIASNTLKGNLIMTKKQKITAVLALAFAFSLGIDVRMLLLHLGKGRRNPQNGRDHSGHRLHLRRCCSCRTEDRPARRRRQDHSSAGRNAQGSRTAFLRGAAGKTCGAFSQRRGCRSFRVKMKPGWEFASGRAFHSIKIGIIKQEIN